MLPIECVITTWVPWIRALTGGIEIASARVSRKRFQKVAERKNRSGSRLSAL